MPWFSAACLVTAALLLIAAAFALPALFSSLSGLRWWHLLVAAALAPFGALANTRGAGSTDINFAPVLASAALAVFGAWGGSAGGVPSGLVAAGVVLGVAQSAAEMGFSFAAGYTSMTSPTAVFAAHVAGCLGGALFAPFTYTLLNSDAQLSPLAAPARELAAVFAENGLGALPVYAAWSALAALVVGVLLAGTRDTMGERARVLIPMPVVMGVIFVTGANVAGESGSNSNREGFVCSRLAASQPLPHSTHTHSHMHAPNPNPPQSAWPLAPSCASSGAGSPPAAPTPTPR
jgi:hypothetical protein